MQFRWQSFSGKLFKLLPWLIIAGLLYYQISFLRQNNELHDFGSFIASGIASKAGDNPYGVYPLTSRAEHEGQTVYYPNLNPPVSVLVFEKFTEIDPLIGKNILTVISIILYIAALVPLFLAYKVPFIWFAWALALTGFWDTLVLGQIYVFIFIAVVPAWLMLRNGKEIPAGILIGLAAAIKPNLLLWPLLLFLAGSRRTAIWALCVFIFLSLLPVFRYGHQVYFEWFQAVSNASWTALPHYVSLFGLANRVGIPWLAYPLSLLLVGAVSWWAWRMRGDVQWVSGVAITAAILVSPLATARFTILLIPLYYYLLKQPKLWLSAAALLFPSSLLIWIGFQSDALSIALSLMLTLALFLLLWLSLKGNSDVSARAMSARSDR